MGTFEDQRQIEYLKNMENMSKTILSLVETINKAREENSRLLKEVEKLKEEIKKKKNA